MSAGNRARRRVVKIGATPVTRCEAPMRRLEDETK